MWRRCALKLRARLSEGVSLGLGVVMSPERGSPLRCFWAISYDSVKAKYT